MHELSAARNIVEIVTSHIPGGEPSRIRKIRLRIGEAAGIAAGSLEFCFQGLATGTLLENTFLEIERVPFTVCCQRCGATNRADPALTLCPACESVDVRVIAGCEFDVVSIEVENRGEEVA